MNLEVGKFYTKDDVNKLIYLDSEQLNLEANTTYGVVETSLTVHIFYDYSLGTLFKTGGIMVSLFREWQEPGKNNTHKKKDTMQSPLLPFCTLVEMQQQIDELKERVEKLEANRCGQQNGKRVVDVDTLIRSLTYQLERLDSHKDDFSCGAKCTFRAVIREIKNRCEIEEV